MSSPTNVNEATVSTVQEKSYMYGRRATVAQCLATFIVCLTYFGVGTQISMPTIVVGNLLNSKNDTISFNEDEASWFGSIPFLLQPVGALIGILMQDYFSQKYSLWLSNLLTLTFFITLYNASTTGAALLSSVWMALGLGFTEPSGIGYISEYSEARLRGYLCASTIVMMSIGGLFVYFVSALVVWRTTLVISALVPVLALLLLPWIPESPVWLLSKGRKKKALRALTWLRGWVRIEDVEEEFEDLDNYVKTSLTYSKHGITGTRSQPTLSELLSSILEKRTLYPFFLLGMFQVTILMASSTGAKVYVLNLLKALQIPIDANWLTLSMGIANTAGTLVVILVLKYTGKRKIAVLATFLAALMSLCIGVFVHYKDELQMPWLFILLLFILTFASHQGGMIPWLMMGEVFPVRTRHAGSGFAGAFFDISLFVIIKTYFVMDRLLGTALFFVINGLIGWVGCLYLYLYLPETEGKSLAEIENIFTKKRASKLT